MKPHVDFWGRPQPSPLAQEVVWAASYAANPPAFSTGRHHRLKALALFQRMLATDFTPLAELVNAEARIAKQAPPIRIATKQSVDRILRERDIERYLVKRVKALGGEVRKVAWQGRAGAPDRLVMLPEVHNDRTGAVYGGAWWVELKAPGVKPEPHQLREHERMRAMGQRVVVIDSTEGVEELLS